MHTEQDTAELIQKIANSRKYKNIYGKTIERIVKQCLEKYERNQVEKKARNILHQIWGAYYEYRPDFRILLAEFKENINSGLGIEESLLKILPLQSSVRERIPILNDFYRKIFSVTGYPNSIIDHACGLNPLTVFWMNLPENTKYQAFDIDNVQIDFLRSVFEFLGLGNQIEVGLGDVMVDEFDYSDVVFMLKLLPLLEQQSKGLSLEVMRRQRCNHLVVSFPVKSLSGIEKGMAEFYSNWFENLIGSEAWKYEKIFFETELVFIVRSLNLLLEC